MDELRRARPRVGLRRRRRSGLTLVEVMVALGILSFGMLAMLTMQIHAMRGGKTSRHTTQAAQIARDRMEFFHRIEWTDTDLDDTAGWQLAGQLIDTQIETQGGATTYADTRFTVDWQIQDVAADLKQLDVRVTWREPADPPGMPDRRFAATSMRYRRR